MEPEITFILGLHNHQPVGNFDHVIEEAYSKAYYPFLEVLIDYPDIPFAIHNSGILWDWIARKHPEYMQLLEEMVTRGQVEIMSGGYYEPILSVIPERDRQGQLAMMNDFVRGRFKTEPRGCWLTERIWEPHLPRTLSDAGLEYVVVDDAHFKSTGFKSDQMRGFFMTEEDSAFIGVFPIDKKLRYLIPFHDPEETISYLHELAGRAGKTHGIAVLADDGEKFGLWTGTHSLCYKREWLRRFCDSLMDSGDWLRMTTFSKAIDKFSPVGIVYLPTASYSEMMEWALPPAEQLDHIEAENILQSSGKFEEPADIVRGGFWRNFLVKYEESNWMHKRMLLVSAMVEGYRKETGEDKTWEEARNHLYQAQCNCAYWHGLFGGLYLPHLRSAVFSHLVAAESLIDGGINRTKNFIDKCRLDIDGDGVEELILRNRSMTAIFKLRGGVLRELDINKPAFNLTDTLTRREELYHRRLTSTASEARERVEEAVSIHDVSSAKESNLDKHLIYDFHLRSSLLDHFIATDVGLEAFRSATYDECGDFLCSEYELKEEGGGKDAFFVFERAGSVDTAGLGVGVMLSKKICLSTSAPKLEVQYTLKPTRGDLKCRFTVESVFSLLAGNAPDRYFRFPKRRLSEANLASSGEEADVGSFSIVDEWLNVDIGFKLMPKALIWRFPIETVSNSESGFERVYQGSAVAAVWPIDLKEGNAGRFRIALEVKPALRQKGRVLI